MKQRLNKLAKKMNNRMFDVAAAPMYVMIFGAPVLLAILVIGLLILAFKALKKIDREKKDKKP